MADFPAAQGSDVIVGIARESEWTVPNTAAAEPVVYYRGIPPLPSGLVRAEVDSPELASGFAQPGIPGAITGPFDLGIMARSSDCLELEECLHACEAAKTTLEAGYAYSYEWDPLVDRTSTSLRTFLGFPSPGGTNRLARWHLFGAKIAEISTTVTANQPVVTRFKGEMGCATRYDLPAAEAVTGTYPNGPYLRGPVRRKFPSGRNIYLAVSQDVAGGGLEFQAQLADAAPPSTWVGAAQAVAYDAFGNGIWQRIHVSVELTGTVSVGVGGTALTGVDTLFQVELEVGDRLRIDGETVRVTAIASNTAATVTAHTAGASAVAYYLKDYAGGYETENWDPLMVIWPGTSTEHALLDVDDTYVATAPGGWADPSPTFLAGQRFTGAHWYVETAALGASTWYELKPQSGTVSLAWPLSPDDGPGSRYHGALDRTGLLAPKINIPRRWRDLGFEELLEAGERFQLRVTLRGRLLGDEANGNREMIQRTFPRVALIGAGKPVANAESIIETLDCKAESDPDTGASPVTTLAVTHRDWAPIAA